MADVIISAIDVGVAGSDAEGVSIIGTAQALESRIAGVVHSAGLSLFSGISAVPSPLLAAVVLAAIAI